MPIVEHVPLDRTFSPLHATDEDAETHEIAAFVGRQEPIDWAAVENSHRAVILAGAGIGKTHEMKKRAEAKLEAGCTSFFVRIEDIIEDFEFAFEVGDDDAFKAWLSSSNEAWFYLDSIDEARLEDPRAFERAIRRFARRIRTAQHRAHIVISSRPYAWRSYTDHVMVEKHLPYALQRNEVVETSDPDDIIDAVLEQVEAISKSDDVLRVFVLNDLTEADIRVFAEARGVADADRLVDDIQRRNLMAVASRPFDLESIIEKWKKDGELGGRFDFLNFGIDKRLSESNPDRDRRQPLNRERARAGARRLAAAVVLSGKSGIRVPDERPHRDGIDAATILGDWQPADVHALLERGTFDDVIYGKVRFRHREVRELLAAEWLAEHLRTGNSNRAVENLIFREKYGHRFMAPRLRPLLPWLILLDAGIRQKAISLSPEIVVEGGDPSRLPLEERQRLLRDIVTRIVEDIGARSARENDAIARIAEPDLSEDVLQLIDAHWQNDSALFFLGRLVWQGEMTACVGPMAELAVDSSRGQYVRIAAVRAVATAGSRDDFDAIWDRVTADEHRVDRRLAAEILSHAKPNSESIDRLLSMIDRLAPFQRFQSSGLSASLHEFIDGFEVREGEDQHELARLICALNDILGREPHLKGGGEKISRDQSWLLSAAAHAAERLISERSPHALDDDAVAVLHKVSSARFWHDVDLSEHAKRLQKAVPEWPKLNDTVFWSAISTERARSEATDGARVIDPLRAPHHNYSSYGSDDFDRVLTFISDREHVDDKRVAITLAHRLVKDLEFPDEALAILRGRVECIPQLSEHLESLVNWRPSKSARAMQRRYEQEERKRSRKDAIAAEYHRRWIARLVAEPSLVRRPDSVEPGQMTNYQAALMEATSESDNSRWSGKNWRSLIATFGEDVSAAYRDAAMDHWRNYSPALASEGIDTTRVPQALIFGLAGLEIEAEQVEEFPLNLSDDELQLAMRYATRELNGFPKWLEKAFHDRPESVAVAMLHELAWDLGREEAPRSYILHDIVYHAPWLHAHIADWVIGWLETHAPRDTDVLRQAIFIAKSTAEIDRLLSLARAKVEEQSPISEQANWFALWVDTDADTAIPRLKDWLGSLPPDAASTAAQHFITDLLGSRRGGSLATGFDSYRTPAHLRRLYVLMHEHIRAEEDIQRAGGGVYSPGLRDDAQDARNGLLNALCDIPGKETYVALRELAEDHPIVSSRAWMSRTACERAEKDGDIEEWSEVQLRQFDAEQSMTPATNAQLYDVVVQRLIDIRAWLEGGDDSPYQIWQRVEAETEMRNLIAGRLNDLANGRYACAQENEMPNAQRPDIWVQRPGLIPVPIELKLLDKNWSGPALCERLRNQLAGDYLRAEGGGRGVMLLVWQGRETDRRWRIGKHLVDLGGLEDTLQDYWHAISRDWPEINEVKVIVIDLTRRGRRSET